MNARQKAKHYKKQLTELYEDYISSMETVEKAMGVASKKISNFEDSRLICSAEKQFDEPPILKEDDIFELLELITHDENFRRAAVLYEYTDPETNKHVVRMELTALNPMKNKEE